MVRGESIVGKGLRDGVLTLVSGVSVRDLPIGPTEAFVLSRVEGSITKAELVTATGLSAEEVDGIVARLILLGALEFADRQAMASPVQSPTQRSGSHSIPLAARSQPVSDLSLEQQQRLLDLDQRHQTLDHYQLLGVEPSADDKAIRAAYYELVRLYHPDRHFGKQLGAFEASLTRVFGRFTEAYEVLHRSESRAEYDRYLGARRRTTDFDRYFENSPRASNPPESVSGSSIPPASGSYEPRPLDKLRPSSSAPPSDPDARRRALARKLGHSSMPPSGSQAAAAVSEPARAAEELKRRYEQRMVQARDEQIEHYVALSTEAAARGWRRSAKGEQARQAGGRSRSRQRQVPPHAGAGVFRGEPPGQRAGRTRTRPRDRAEPTDFERVDRARKTRGVTAHQRLLGFSIRLLQAARQLEPGEYLDVDAVGEAELHLPTLEVRGFAFDLDVGASVFEAHRALVDG